MASASRAKASSNARHERFERFAARFLFPLLAGGKAEVDQPLPASDLAHFAVGRAADSEIDLQTFEAFHAIARELLPGVHIPYPEESAVALAMASYNLLVLADPSLDRTIARRAIAKVEPWATSLVEGVEVPRSVQEALARHVVVDRLLLLRRKDVIVKSWASTHRFEGRKPTWNVVAWPKIRRVRQQAEQRTLLEIVRMRDANEMAHPSGRMSLEGLLRRIVTRSPITELLRADLLGEHRFGLACLNLLSDARLRGAIARELVRLDLARYASILEDSLLHLLQRASPPGAVDVALALCLEALLTDALDNRSPRDPMRLATNPSSQRFAALLPLSSSLTAPTPKRLSRWLALHSNDLHRISRLARRMHEAIPKATIDEMKSAVESNPWTPA